MPRRQHPAHCPRSCTIATLTLSPEKADDQVVIEVKPSRALKGANDLKELADRVTAERGWRLELMAPRTADEDALVPTSHWLGRMLRPPSPGTDTSHHCVYLGEVLDCLIRGVALINNIRVRDKTMLRIARQLVFVGVLGQNLLDRIEDTLDRRDHLMHGLPVSRSAAEQAAEIEKLCRDLHAQAQHSED